MSHLFILTLFHLFFTQGKKSYFYKNSAWTINSLGVPYDYASVMHYGPRAFSKDGVSVTIEVKGNGQGIGNIWQRHGLSDKNKQQAQKLYGCKGTCYFLCFLLNLYKLHSRNLHVVLIYIYISIYIYLWGGGE